MKTTAQLFNGYAIQTKKSHRTERGDLISFFSEKINPDRVKAGYGEISMSRLAHLLSIYSTENLYQLRMKCERAKNFGACFNYYLFPKK